MRNKYTHVKTKRASNKHIKGSTQHTVQHKAGNNNLRPGLDLADLGWRRSWEATGTRVRNNTASTQGTQEIHRPCGQQLVQATRSTEQRPHTYKWHRPPRGEK